MERIDTDILVIGGGVAGLTATAALASAGFDVVCVDQAPPVLDEADPKADLRTTAFLTPSVDTLARAGVWEALAGEAAPLWTMRLIDAGGREADVARDTVDFDAGELQDRPFGWNLRNTSIRRALLGRISAMPNAALRAPAGLVRLLARSDETIAALTDGAQVRARLAVAADGRDSEARRQAGIAARRWSYAQKALVFAVAHDLPHHGVSTEIHRSGGPFTLVPLPDYEGRPASSVVWMEAAARAGALMEIDEAAFTAEAQERSCHVLGRLRLITRRTVWPMIGQLALRLDGPRLALVGETAHVVPPIGAQGLNMSLADIATLIRVLEEARAAGRDIGEAALLARYHRARWPEMAARVAGIDALNRASMAGAQPLRDLRRAGMKAIHDIPFLRRAAMRAGMGAR